MAQREFTAVTERVQRWVEHGFYPGAGLIIGRGEQILLEQYFGGYTPETEEFIASAGKWLAAAAISAVVDQRLLSWEDTVAEWLPEFVGEAGQIRLRQLLSHTSFVERVRAAQHTGVYGLGLWRERLDPEGRATQLSSPSWAGTYPWIDQERGVYGVLIAHVDLAGPAWDGGFNPYYSSAVLAELVAGAI